MINLEKKYEILISGEIYEKSLKDILSGSEKTLIYFYPKDNTPGCTLENKDFSCLRKEFLEKGIQLIGVSKDSIESHKKFVEKQAIENSLISDPELILHKEFGAFGEKNNYGKIIQGVIRSTFLLDSNGNILKEYKNVKATGHAERILKEM
ncbi:peroxiredoxin [Candidatus Gracilibacteria bacterium]|nr:MAG: peroxiredoxin [Candidatus Gracilibacteria bacterium]